MTCLGVLHLFFLFSSCFYLASIWLILWLLTLHACASSRVNSATHTHVNPLSELSPSTHEALHTPVSRPSFNCRSVTWELPPREREWKFPSIARKLRSTLQWQEVYLFIHFFFWGGAGLPINCSDFVSLDICGFGFKPAVYFGLYTR